MPRAIVIEVVAPTGGLVQVTTEPLSFAGDLAIEPSPERHCILAPRRRIVVPLEAELWDDADMVVRVTGIAGLDYVRLEVRAGLSRRVLAPDLADRLPGASVSG